jgi:hypothetical protein
VIDLPSLMLPMQTRKGLKPYEKVIQNSRIGVHGSIEEPDLPITGIDFPESSFELYELLIIKFAGW